MKKPTRKSPKTPMKRTMTAAELAGTRGGFNPQPEPPGMPLPDLGDRWLSFTFGY